MTKKSTAPRPTDPAPFADDDPRATFARAVALGATVIDRVQPGQLGLPTPCPEMDVRRLLGHLVMVLQRVAAAGRGQDPSTWPGEVTGLADDAWAAAWTEAAHEVRGAWTEDATLARDTVLPWATVTGEGALRIYTNEVTVHTWDLARATGQEPEWDEAVLEVSLATMQEALPAAGRAEGYEEAKAALPPGVPWADPFAPAVEVPEDAPLVDRLVAWNGRRP